MPKDRGPKSERAVNSFNEANSNPFLGERHVPAMTRDQWARGFHRCCALVVRAAATSRDSQIIESREAVIFSLKSAQVLRTSAVIRVQFSI